MEHTFSEDKQLPDVRKHIFGRQKVVRSSFALHRVPKTNKVKSAIGNFVKFPDAFNIKPWTRGSEPCLKLPSISSDKDRVFKRRRVYRKPLASQNNNRASIESLAMKTPRFGMLNFN